AYRANAPEPADYLVGRNGHCAAGDAGDHWEGANHNPVRCKWHSQFPAFHGWDLGQCGNCGLGDHRKRKRAVRWAAVRTLRRLVRSRAFERRIKTFASTP